jgi:hypothetical protein
VSGLVASTRGKIRSQFSSCVKQSVSYQASLWSAWVCHKYKRTKFPAAEAGALQSLVIFTPIQKDEKGLGRFFFAKAVIGQRNMPLGCGHLHPPRCVQLHGCPTAFTRHRPPLSTEMYPQQHPATPSQRRSHRPRMCVFVLTDRMAPCPYIVVIWRRYVTRHACWSAVPVRRRRSHAALHCRRAICAGAG